MSVKPITRMEHILAGENITPIGRKEYFVQQAVQNGGGSTDIYETVAEIAVGEMEGEDGHYGYSTDASEIPDINPSEIYYLNSATDPSTIVQVDRNMSFIGFNLKFDGETGETQTRIDLSKPLVGVVYGEDSKAIVYSDTTDLSNTTVKILKKVSTPSGGGKFVVPITMSQQGVSSDVTLNQIKSAFDDKQSVVAQYSVGTGTAEIPLIDIGETHVLFSGFISTGENVEIRYQTVGGWSYKRTQIKPTYEFDFTVTAGQEAGTYVATPDSGVTYAAITAALAETPHVYFTATLPTGEKLRAAVDDIDVVNSFVCANGMFYTGSSFTAYRLKIQSDETCHLDMKPLQNAT